MNEILERINQTKEKIKDIQEDLNSLNVDLILVEREVKKELTDKVETSVNSDPYP